MLRITRLLQPFHRGGRPTIARYAAAIVLGGMAVIIGAAFSSPFGSRFPFITLYAALTMAAAWFGGLCPGLICTGICALAVDYYWLEPVRAIGIRSPHDMLNMAIFLATCIVISLLCEQLQRAQRREAAMRRQREHMLEIVAHDLRNPLGTIQMSAALIERRAAPGEEGAPLRKQSGVVRRAALQMDRLIGDLLDWSSAEAGRLSIEIAHESAREILEEAVEAHLPLAEQRRVQLECDARADLPEVLCDRSRVLQVLTNLIGNALKFTPSGGRISVSAEPISGFVRFSVRDTGPGIAARDLPMIFEYHWHTARSARGGTGLGLYIAKAIIDAHGGALAVESRAGQAAGTGATFSFTLPALR